jgi:3-phenylpropionate/trans-cinnamate dioxygenase ferredoxin subunit
VNANDEVSALGAWLRIGSIGEAPAEGALRAFPLDPRRTVCVARLEDGTLVCFDDTCTHEECPLSDGDLEGDHVVCYCHSGEFDVRTGAVVKGPPEDPLPVYELRESAGELEIRLPD